jgi:hypothetical protein
MDHTFLTYDEAAKRLHIKADSVRRRARARKWPRREGNDGLVLVGVPSELLTPDSTPDKGQDSPPGHPPGHPPDARLGELEVEVKLLRSQLEDLRSDRDAWRDQAQALAGRGGFWSRLLGR